MLSVDARVRRLALIALAALLVAGCAGHQPLPTSGAGTPRSAPSTVPSTAPSTVPSTAPSTAPTLVVVARDLSFTPRELTADRAAPVTLTLQNDGRVVHNLTIDELGVQIIVSPGQTGSTTLADVPAGSYTYYCSVSGHRLAGMFGTLTVR